MGPRHDESLSRCCQDLHNSISNSHRNVTSERSAPFVGIKMNLSTLASSLATWISRCWNRSDLNSSPASLSRSIEMENQRRIQNSEQPWISSQDLPHPSSRTDYRS